MHAERYELSPVQQGMLFHWLLDRHSGTNVEQIVADLHESLDVERFDAAWTHIVRTFATLRTVFHWEGLPTPLQSIAPDATLRIAHEDLRALAPDARERRCEEYLRDDRREGFDLAAAPAMRVMLFRVADAHYRMVWSFHHILIDGRNFETVLGELFAHYEQGSTSTADTGAYREYIDWVTRQDHSTALAFWRERLKGFAATTPVPQDRSVAAADRFGQWTDRLTREQTSALRQLAEREGLSMNTIVLSAWSLLLARYSGEPDVVIGVTKTTRRGTIQNADDMLGVFLATIPLRVAVDLSRPTTEWLRGVREEWVSLRGAEHVSLVDIKQVSDLPPQSSLFDSLVVFESYDFAERLTARGGSWANRHFQLREQTGYPLTLKASDGDELVLTLEYDAQRVEQATATRIIGHVGTVLSAWAADASGQLSATPLLTAAERETILEEWNRTETEYPRDVPLAQLVEEQVRRAPDAIAVVSGDARLTYAELNARANQLARELRVQGAGPDKVVGICIERSLEMAVALLAVVKSGAGYLPLDPAFPRDRLEYMIGDSGLQTLVTTRALRASLTGYAGPAVEIESPEWQAHDTADLEVPVGPEALAYVLYTSGSTGRPKGVMCTRGSLTNIIWSIRSLVGLQPADRLLAVTTISFDIASFEIWGPWTSGAQIILASREDAADAPALIELLARHDATMMQATPITWRMMLDAGWKGKADLQVLSAGEPLPPEVVAHVPKMVKRLWNLYGPTETTIYSTWYPLAVDEERVAIGRPVANTRCYILDKQGDPVPVGVLGELYIGGEGVARGYLNRDDLTAEKFVPDPFVGGGARMYRTGDLAAYRPDGLIDCLGRTDSQVKLRGYRIELGEIESTLAQHDGVRQAVVILREDRPGEKRLVAYVRASDPSIDTTVLRAHLKGSLPEYFIPSAFVVMDEFPLTANGKIDRRSLPSPTQDTAATDRQGPLARTYVEQQLSEIWQDIFSLTSVGVNADFFELGGHSLLAMKLMARIRQVFGKRLPLNTLFESPTIEQLAKHVESDRKSVGKHTLVPIQASGTRLPLFWIPGGAAVGLINMRGMVGVLGSDQPVYGLGSMYPDSLDEVEDVEQRARSYVQLVRSLQPQGPYVLTGYCAGGHVAFEMAQQLIAAGDEVAFVGMINCRMPGYPSSRIVKSVVKLQRLLHEVGAARSEGQGILEYGKTKLSARRTAVAEREQLREVRERVCAQGFQQVPDDNQNEVLLQATAEAFGRYRPRPLPGRIALFISQDPELLGVSRRFDPRVRWQEFAEGADIWEFPGGHSIIEMEDQTAFAKRLKEAIDRTVGSNATRRRASGE